MSRRKQAKPKLFKPDFDINSCDDNLSTNISVNAILLGNQDVESFEVSSVDLGEIVYSSPLSNSNLPTESIDSLESGELAIDQENSWFSATPENSQTSPAPSSCTTPNSIADLPDAELSFTLGITESTPYGCSFCNKAFQRLSSLKKHEQIHSDQMPFRCEFCSRLFKHKRSKDRHIKLHTGDKKYRCNLCDAAFSRSDHLKIHMKTHDNQKPFQCKICTRGYNTAAALTSHIQNHKKQQMDNLESTTTVQPNNNLITSVDNTVSPNNFPCKHCGECFQKLEYLQSHISSAHLTTFSDREDNLISSLLDITDGVSSDVSQITTKLACIYCSKGVFCTVEQLQLHVQVMHRSLLNGDLCNFRLSESLNKRKIASPQLTSPSRDAQTFSVYGSYTCDICCMQFSSMQRLQNHTLNIHQNYDINNLVSESTNSQNAFMCIKCALSFQSSNKFVEHYLRVHGNNSSNLILMSPVLEKAELSSNCSKFHSENRKLKRQCVESVTEHTKAINGQYEHSGILLCNQCNAALPDFESFRTHLKCHLEQSCLSNNTQNADSNIFAIVQSDSTKIDTNSYSCPHCSLNFKDFDAYEQHVGSHFLTTAIEYECKACLKVFLTSDELQNHLMDLHAHHIYRCALCKEMFDSKVAIQIHFAVNHSNETKLYRCAACPYESVHFHSKLEFSLHVRNTHSIQAHFGNSHPKMLHCTFCRQCFSTDIEMQFHLTSHSKQFHCPLCPEKFQIEFLLDRHLETYHSTNQIMKETNIAAEDNSNKNILSSNVSSLHSPSTPSNMSEHKNTESDNNKQFNIFECDIYDRSDVNNATEPTSSNELKSVSKYGNVSLHCAYCGETCKSRTDIENHLKHHSQDGGTLGKFKCNICDEICPTAVILAEHKLTHCKIISGSKCTHCRATITSKEQFYLHQTQHSNNNKINCRKSKSQVLLPSPCVVCRQTLTSDIEVKIHLQFHLNNSFQLKEYECSICLKSTDKKNIIVSSSDNSLSTCYKCKDCYISSTGKENLEYTSRCSECHIICSNNSILNQHLNNIHIKSCVKCQSSFENKLDDKINFTNNNHRECNLCRRLFNNSVELQTHLIEHTFAGCDSFTCYICSAVFTAPNGLQNHILEHGLSTRPYDCRKCNKKFFFRSELENHNYTHFNTENERSLNCITSDLFFSRYSEQNVYKFKKLNNLVLESTQPVSLNICDECKKDPEKCEHQKNCKGDTDRFTEKEIKHENDVFIKIEPVENVTERYETEEKG